MIRLIFEAISNIRGPPPPCIHQMIRGVNEYRVGNSIEFDLFVGACARTRRFRS